MKLINTIHSDKNPGHYSPGIIYNGVLYISGQLSIDPELSKVPEGGIEVETRQALKNLEEVLLMAGTSKDKVLKITVYIPNVDLWPIVNNIYAEFFGSHKPARTIVPTNDLHYGCLIEIDGIAAIE